MSQSTTPPVEIPEHIAKVGDGELVLTGGRHRVEGLFNGERMVADREVRQFWDNFEQRRAWCTERNIRYAHWVFPDALVLKRDLVPGGDRMSSVFQRTYGGERPTEGCFYPLDFVASDPAHLLKTDTHFSPLCNFRLSGHVLQNSFDWAPGADFALPSETEGVLERAFAGDLGVQCDPHITEEVFRPRPPQGMRMASNGVQAGNDGIFVLVENANALRDETLLIFGDSYFRLLLPYLSYTFRKIAFCRTRFFQYEIVDAFKPSVILSGNAERYLTRVPADADRPHFFTYPLALGRSQQPDAGMAELWGEIVQVPGLLAGAPAGSAAPDPRASITEHDLAFAIWSATNGDELRRTGGDLAADWQREKQGFSSKARRVLQILDRARGTSQDRHS